jgi:hypothetical protein
MLKVRDLNQCKNWKSFNFWQFYIAWIRIHIQLSQINADADRNTVFKYSIYFSAA